LKGDRLAAEKTQSKFIVLDGPDGCGKSTQARLLAEWLQNKGQSIETFRDPGTTPIGEKIRDILLNPDHALMCTRTELLLYMAARAQLWDQQIAPALDSGKCVILDRWLSSTCAYQGYAGEFGIDNVIHLAENSLERSWPDLTIILDIDLDSAAPRLNAELDRMEQKPDQYQNKVRQGFLQLAENQKNFEVVDARPDIQTVHKTIIEIIEKIF
jgi:dTMP kinase